MGKFRGWFVMALCCCMLCAATVHAKSLQKVYLKDGGIIECQKYWQENGRVMALVNRDVLVELAPEEVNMKRTFSQKPAKAVKKKAPSVRKKAPAVKGAPAAGPQTPAPSGKAPADAGKTGAAPAPKTGVQPPGPASQAPGQKPAAAPAPQKPAAQPPGPASQAPGQKPAAAPASQKPSAQPPGPANQAPGQKPAALPAPQNAPAPASVAKPVPPGQGPPAAKAPAAPETAPVRTTLPIVDVKPQPPAPRAPGFVPGMGTVLLFLLLVLFLIASLWKVFTKAGEAGWQCLIPLWNAFVLVKISGKPWWWFLLLFIPVVNLIVYILVFISLAARFNRGVLFGLGLFFLGFIFFPVLAFGNAEYQ